jgi:hypothetical protein
LGQTWANHPLVCEIAEFFASDGASIIDPDGSELLFERPIAGPLPETLNFIP